MKKAKWISFLVVCTMLVSLALAGYGQTQTDAEALYQAEIDKGEVHLVFYLIGEGPNDFQMAVDAINEKMKADINTTIEFKCIPWADWNTKYDLLFNSGEEFDGAFATSWANYKPIATKGGFYEIDEATFRAYCPNFAPQIFDGTHDYLWENSEIGGQRYLVPQIYDWQNTYTAVIRGDLAKKYEINVDELDTFEELMAYAQAVGSNESGVIAYNAMGSEDKVLNSFAFAQSWKSMDVKALMYNMTEDGGQVFNMLDTKEFEEFAVLMRELQTAGAFSKSVLSNPTDSATNFRAGMGAISIDGFGGSLNVYMEVMRNNPEFEPVLIDYLGDVPKEVPTPFDGGMAVCAVSKNPQRALMAIDLLMGVREYNELLALGIPGTHWNPVGDDKYESLEAGLANFTPYGACPWGLNTHYMRVDEETPELAGELRAKWAGQAKQLKIDGFTMDNEAFQSQIAAITAAYEAEWPAMVFGLREDPVKAVQDLNAQLKNAGLDEVMAEMQTQLDAYIASR